MTTTTNSPVREKRRVGELEIRNFPTRKSPKSFTNTVDSSYTTVTANYTETTTEKLNFFTLISSFTSETNYTTVGTGVVNIFTTDSTKPGTTVLETTTHFENPFILDSTFKPETNYTESTTESVDNFTTTLSTLDNTETATTLIETTTEKSDESNMILPITSQYCNFGQQILGFSDQLSQQERTVRFVRFRVKSFFGDGGGLRQLVFNGELVKKGNGSVFISISITSILQPANVMVRL